MRFVVVSSDIVWLTNEGIRGYLPGRIVFFLMNLQINKKPIWITRLLPVLIHHRYTIFHFVHATWLMCMMRHRHGESQFNVTGKIGGDSDLSPLGQVNFVVFTARSRLVGFLIIPNATQKILFAVPRRPTGTINTKRRRRTPREGPAWPLPHPCRRNPEKRATRRNNGDITVYKSTRQRGKEGGKAGSLGS